MQKQSFKVFRNGKQIGTATFFGKTQKQVVANARRYGRVMTKRNVAEGFYDSRGEFHPIRASRDYSYRKAGEHMPSHSRKAERKRKRGYKKAGKRSPS